MKRTIYLILSSVFIAAVSSADVVKHVAQVADIWEIRVVDINLRGLIYSIEDVAAANTHAEELMSKRSEPFPPRVYVVPVDHLYRFLFIPSSSDSSITDDDARSIAEELEKFMGKRLAQRRANK